MILLIPSYNYIIWGGVINPCYAGDESCDVPYYLCRSTHFLQIGAELAEMTYNYIT
jgi:hypothetical protein